MTRDPPTSQIDWTEAEFVERLARSLGCADQPELIGEGVNNWVYRANADSGPIAVRLGKPVRAHIVAEEFRKEKWCAAVARAAGIETPEVLGVGDFEGRAYLLQAFCPGRPVSAGEDAAPYFEALGRMARAANDITVTGWGPRFTGDGVFGQTWEDHLAYNVACLTPDDPLIGLGVLDAANSAAWRAWLARLAGLDVRMGLCHGDLALWNLIVGENGTLTLIDWGCARAAPVPFQEFVETTRDGRAQDVALDAFARGYGLSPRGLKAIRPLTAAFLALREIDTLRWTLEHNAGGTANRAIRARSAVDGLLALA
ncbi:MAG TPA: aminoglycoside phosphotransferase family protein [Caulobacteraceae bacterium]